MTLRNYTVHFAHLWLPGTLLQNTIRFGNLYNKLIYMFKISNEIFWQYGSKEHGHLEPTAFGVSTNSLRVIYM